MYELFILGELKDKPMHGYLLHSILSQMIGPLRQVSWGTLYSVIRRMEEDGLIHQVVKEQTAGQGRVRKVYELTPQGDTHFHRLMRQPFVHNDETEDLFRVKMGNFCYVQKEVALEVVRQYRAFLEVAIGGIDLGAEKVRREICISDEERPHILNVIGYEAAVYEAKLAWVESFLAKVQTWENFNGSRGDTV